MSTKRLQKSLNERIYLMAANQVEVDKWEFKVRAQSLNVYDQCLTTNSFTCSCIDQKKNKHFCKHLLFLIVRVAPKQDIAEQLISNKTVWNEKHFNECSTLWIERLKSRINREEIIKSQKERLKTQKSKVANINDAYGQDCSICFEVMNNGEDITCCEAMCKNFFHNDCIKQWFASGHDNCPLCRTKWKINKKTSEVKGKNKIINNISFDDDSLSSETNDDSDSEHDFYDVHNQLDTLVERNTNLKVNFLDPKTILPIETSSPSITSTLTNTTISMPKTMTSSNVKKTPKKPTTKKESKKNEPQQPHPQQQSPQQSPQQTPQTETQQETHTESENNQNPETERQQLTDEQVEELFFLELRNFIQEKLGKSFEEILLERLLQISGLQLSDLQTADDENQAESNQIKNQENTQTQLPSYQILNVITPTNIKDFCESKGVEFVKGKILHEMVRQETIYADKDLIVFNRHTGIMYTNSNAKNLLKLNDYSVVKCKPKDFPDHRIFIHTNSPTRKLIPGQAVFIRN